MANFTELMQQQLTGALGSLQGVSDRYQKNTAAAQQGAINGLGEWRNKTNNLQYDPKIGALRASAAMLAPTKTGGFGESLGGALSVMGDAKEKELGFNMDKYDKMARMDEALGKMRIGAAGLEYGTMTNNIDMMNSLGNQNNSLLNQQFAQAEQPYKLRALDRIEGSAQADADFAPLDEASYIGDDGQFDYAKGAQATYQDYLANPAKYKGPQGQKMVDDAMQVLRGKMQSDTTLEAAGIRANRGGKKTLDVGTMKAIRDKQGIVGKASSALSKIRGIDEALEYASSGPGSEWVMKGSSWMGDKKAAKALSAIDQLSLFGLEEVSQYLKPMSESDAATALAIYGNPNASPTQKLQGLAILRHGMKMTIALEQEEARALASGEYYQPDYSPLNNPKVKELFETQGEALWKSNSPPKKKDAEKSGSTTYTWTPDGGLQ